MADRPFWGNFRFEAGRFYVFAGYNGVRQIFSLFDPSPRELRLTSQAERYQGYRRKAYGQQNRGQSGQRLNPFFRDGTQPDYREEYPRKSQQDRAQQNINQKYVYPPAHL
jgi:hypothetical protein